MGTDSLINLFILMFNFGDFDEVVVVNQDVIQFVHNCSNESVFLSCLHDDLFDRINKVINNCIYF